jgi:hypothetical protein
MLFSREDVLAQRKCRTRAALGNLVLATAIVMVCASSGARGDSLVVPFDQSTGYGFPPDFGLAPDIDFGVGEWEQASDIDGIPPGTSDQVLLTWTDVSHYCQEPGDDCSPTKSLIEMIWSVSLNPDHVFDGLPGDDWSINLFLVASDQVNFESNEVGVLYDSAEIDGVPVDFDVAVYADTFYFPSMDLGALDLGETREVRFRYEVAGSLYFDEEENMFRYPFVTGAAFVVVPEPGAGALLALGLVWLGVTRRNDVRA